MAIDVMLRAAGAGVVTPAIGQILIFFGTLFFMLLGRTRLRHVLGALLRTARSAAAHAARS